MRALALTLALLGATSSAQETAERTTADAEPPRIEEQVTVTASPVIAGTRVEPLAGAVTWVGSVLSGLSWSF